MSTRENLLGTLAQCAAALEKWQDGHPWQMEGAEALAAAHDLLRAPWRYAVGYSPGNGGPYFLKRISDDGRTIEYYGGRLLGWRAYHPYSIPKRYTSRAIAARALAKLVADGGKPK